MTYTSISTSSSSPTTIFGDATEPAYTLYVHNDTSSNGVCHVIVDSETGSNDELTVAPGILIPIRRSARIVKAVAYADGGKSVNIYAGVLDR